MKEEPLDFEYFKYLSNNEQEVVMARHRDNKTIEETAKQMGVTQQRIRQIETKAYEKLRTGWNGLAELSTQDLIQATRDLLNAVRGSSIRIGQNLYEIKQTLEPGSNWGDLLRDEFDISESFASKLISIHRVLVVEGGISQEKLEGIDGEKLYLSLKLEGSAEEKVAKAQTLTRREIRESGVDDGHEHSGETVTIHKCCGLRIL